MVTEENLHKTKILEGYYDTRISEIVKFAEETPEELATYREEIPQEELNIQEDIDISSVIDGSIFEEIDEISSGEPDADILKSVLANPDEIPVYEQEETVEPVEIEVSTTNQLESMISEAKSFVEKKKKENAKDLDKEEDEVEQEEQDEGVQEDLDENVETPKVEIEESEDLEEKEEFVDIYVDDDELKDEKLDETDLDPFLDIRGLQEELGFSDEEDEDESESGEVVDLSVEEDDGEVINIDEELISSEKDFDTNDEDVASEFTKLGLDINMFSIDSIDAIKRAFDKETVKEFINIMKKHDLSKDLVYTNHKVLTDVTPQNLDQMLTLLEKTDGNRDDIALAYKYLDKVNVSKLEQIILSDVEPSLTFSLSKAIDDVSEDNISDALGLSRKASEILKKTASKEDYKVMNTLPDIVFENYREIKSFNVDNLEECISKYPHRFALTHSKFHEILDKYDTDDLIRCINKNAAVIDKL